MNLPDLLSDLLGVDNVRRRDAERKYETLKSSSMPQLAREIVSTIRNDSDEGRRGLAAVLLRGIIVHDASTPPESVSWDLRNDILHCMLHEPVGHVQRKIAHAVAALANMAEWPELLHSLPQMSLSPDPRMHYLCYFLIDKLAEYIGPILLDNVGVVWEILSRGLGMDTPLSLRVGAVNAVLSLLHEVPADVLSSSPHSSLLCGLEAAHSIMQAAMEGGDEDNLVALSESVLRLVSNKPELTASCWGGIFEVSTRVCLNADIADTVKCIALGICVQLLTSPSSLCFCSNAESRARFISLCVKLMSDIEITDDGSSPGSNYSYTRPPPSDDFFGDEDGDESDLIEHSTQSLEKMIRVFPIEESISVVCGLLPPLLQGDIGSIRTGLVVTSVLFDTLSAEMQAYLTQIVPVVLNYTEHPSPRIRFCSFRCCKSIILSRESEHEDDEGGNDSSARNFVSGYYTRFLPLALQSLQDNFQFPRVAYAALNSLRAFCDPQDCPGYVLQSFAGIILEAAWSVLNTPQYPLFVMEEAVSLAGNVSLLSPDGVFDPFYIPFMTYLKDTFSSEKLDTCDDAIEISRYKGKCLECAALMGTAVGIHTFHDDAIRLMNEMTAATESGLDYTEPLSSYIVQTCARVAGVLGDSFRPYAERLIPPLLSHISEDLNINIYTEDSMQHDAGADHSDGFEEVSAYKRGLGKIKIVHNSYEVNEREMSCRALYQYMLDVPMLMYSFAPGIMEAACRAASIVLNDEMYLILGALCSDSLKIFVRYADPNDDSCEVAKKMLVMGLDCILGLIPTYSTCSRTREEIENSQVLFDSIREMLKVIADARRYSPGWGIDVSDDMVSLLIAVLLHDSSHWVQRNYTAENSEGLSALQLKTEEDLWLSLSDAFGWLLKASPTPRTTEIFSIELLPFLMGLLQASSEATPLLATGLSVLCDAVDVLPLNHVTVPKSAACDDLVSWLLPHLFQHLRTPELTIDCMFGIGVCAMRADGRFDSIVEQAVCDAGAIIASTCEDDIEQLRIRDVAVSALLKLAVFRQHTLPSSLDIIESCLQMFPLESDPYEAREIHSLVADLVLAGDRRLLGQRFQLLPSWLDILGQLGILCVGIMNELCSANEKCCVGLKDYDEFWDSQVVNVFILNKIKTIVACGIAGMDSNQFQEAKNSTPIQIRQFFEQKL